MNKFIKLLGIITFAIFSTTYCSSITLNHQDLHTALHKQKLSSKKQLIIKDVPCSQKNTLVQVSLVCTTPHGTFMSSPLKVFRKGSLKKNDLSNTYTFDFSDFQFPTTCTLTVTTIPVLNTRHHSEPSTTTVDYEFEIQPSTGFFSFIGF